MKKMLIRILLDLFLIVLGTVLVTGFLSLKPKRKRAEPTPVLNMPTFPITR